ncbi:TPA: hypothetical protein ACQZIF_001967 [Citrobacter freundii]
MGGATASAFCLLAMLVKPLADFISADAFIMFGHSPRSKVTLVLIVKTADRVFDPFFQESRYKFLLSYFLLTV